MQKIEVLEKIANKEKCYKKFRQLGVLFEEKEEFSKAIEYYFKSLELTYYSWEEPLISILELYIIENGEINKGFEKKFLEHNYNQVEIAFLKYEALKLSIAFVDNSKSLDALVHKTKLFFIDDWLREFLNRWLKYIKDASKATAIKVLLKALETPRDIEKMSNEELRDYLLYIHYYDFDDEIQQFYTYEFYEQIDDIEFVKSYIKEALASKSETFSSSAVVLYERFQAKALLENEFNQFLVNPYHNRHQELLLGLQSKRFESSVAYIDRALTEGFELFNVDSEDAVVAKWYSHALGSIGTEEAMAVLKKHSHSENEEIAFEMAYRLKRLEER